MVMENSFIKGCRIKIKGRNNEIYVKNHCVLHKCSMVIHGNNNMIILDEKVSAVNCDIQVEDHGNLVYIGKKTHISGRTHLACIEGRKIVIGERCLFSSDVIFRTGDSHSILDFKGNRINPSQDIEIGNHVWIGNKTIITKGVTIAPNSIVATGAVVTKTVELTNVIIGGIPAKVIKKDVDWIEQRV